MMGASLFYITPYRADTILKFLLNVNDSDCRSIIRQFQTKRRFYSHNRTPIFVSVRFFRRREVKSCWKPCICTLFLTSTDWEIELSIRHKCNSACILKNRLFYPFKITWPWIRPNIPSSYAWIMRASAYTQEEAGLTQSVTSCFLRIPVQITQEGGISHHPTITRRSIPRYKPFKRGAYSVYTLAHSERRNPKDHNKQSG